VRVPDSAPHGRVAGPAHGEWAGAAQRPASASAAQPETSPRSAVVILERAVDTVPAGERNRLSGAVLLVRGGDPKVARRGGGVPRLPQCA